MKTISILRLTLAIALGPAIAPVLAIPRPNPGGFLDGESLHDLEDTRERPIPHPDEYNPYENTTISRVFNTVSFGWCYWWDVPETCQATSVYHKKCGMFLS